MYWLAALDRSRYSKLSKQANKEQKRYAAICSKGQEPRTRMFNPSLNVTLLTLAFLLWVNGPYMYMCRQGVVQGKGDTPSPLKCAFRY